MAAVVVTAPAFAADMQLRAAPPVVNVSPWNGFYLGAGVGGMFNTTLNPDTTGFDLASYKPSGVTYGAFAGRNWQVQNWVVGLEVDFDVANRHASNTIMEEMVTTATIKYLGSARARVGFTLAPNLLVYGTAGVGLANTAASIGLGDMSVDASTNHFGWVAGGGAEWLFTNNWSARIEYKHYDLGKSSYSFGPVVNINIPAALTVDVAKFGLAYKFGV